MERGVGARTRIVVVLALALALALAGCANPGSPSGVPDPTPTSTGPTGDAEPVLLRPLLPVTDRELLEYCPAVDAQHFDGDTAAVLDIYMCSAIDILSTNGSDGTEDIDSGSGALPDVQRASRVVSGGDELLAAYSTPNAPATADACIQLAADPLIVWVNTSAGIAAVYAPVDDCGFPTPGATDAFNGVELDTILEIRADPAD